jgi:protoporphyrin/coproporphyrin ferrochelatase
MSILKAILLVNLGTPEAPTLLAVARYLSEFLTDRRVIDLPFLKRQLLVHGVIIPSRLRISTQMYRSIWTEEGSPLMVHSKKVKELLQERLGASYSVELAMRYQTPAIGPAIEKLLAKQPDELVVLPLFPQYASATTGSIFEAVSQALSKTDTFPKLTFIDQFHAHPLFIKAFEALSAPLNPLGYDHILFSFHGLPERQLKKSDRSGCCLKAECCEKHRPENRFCYAAQCYNTAEAIAKTLKLPKSRYTVCFQSRLGKDPWIRPFTSDTLEQLGQRGDKRVLVFCPAFVADCLETLFEIGVEYKELFRHAGGKTLDLVPGLNAHPAWIHALEAIILGLSCNK